MICVCECVYICVCMCVYATFSLLHSLTGEGVAQYQKSREAGSVDWVAKDEGVKPIGNACVHPEHLSKVLLDAVELEVCLNSRHIYTHTNSII